MIPVSYAMLQGDNMIEKILTEAYISAIDLSQKNSDEDEKKFHSNLSLKWIEFIADELRRRYENDKNIRVFSKGCNSNKSAFKRNEFLFDITVIETSTVPSAKNRKNLEYPKDVIWHIESEFHNSNSRESIIDFSKLLMSVSKNKLMILPAKGEIEKWAKREFPNLDCIKCGNMYLAFIPHPRKWKTLNPDEVKIDIQKIW
jgi:hypothetical protein